MGICVDEGIGKCVKEDFLGTKDKPSEIMFHYLIRRAKNDQLMLKILNECLLLC